MKFILPLWNRELKGNQWRISNYNAAHVCGADQDILIIVWCSTYLTYCDGGQVSWWSSSLILALDARDWGLISWSKFFVGLLIVTNSTQCYIWWPMWSKLELHGDMISDWRVNVIAVMCLDGLVVWCLPRMWETGAWFPRFLLDC